MENKIYNYKNILDKKYNSKSVQTIKGIVDMEDYKSGMTDISIYRAIEINHKNNIVFIHDYEYHNDNSKEYLSKWIANGNYESIVKHICDYGEDDCLIDADSHLLEHFMFDKDIDL